MFEPGQVPTGFVAVTPLDATPLNLVGVMVGGAGTVIVVDGKGVTTTITAVAGQVIWGIIKAVKTASTATGIVGMIV